MTPTRRLPKPPKHLRLATRRWFTWVLENFDMEEHHVKVLTAACESWDRMQQAREAIDKHGITYTDRFDAPKARPEVAIERDSKIVFSRPRAQVGHRGAGLAPARPGGEVDAPPEVALEPLSEALRVYLELGRCGLHGLAPAPRPEGYQSARYFTPASDRAAAWLEHGEGITAAWAAAHAGTRPWGWWQYVAAAPRTCVEGAAFTWKPGHGDWVWKQEFGLPGRPQLRRPGAKPARLLFESQARYLQRLNLLVPGEAERLTAEDLMPEIVEILEEPLLDQLSPRPIPAPALASTNGTHHHHR